jgi:hypothetical protein
MYTDIWVGLREAREAALSVNGRKRLRFPHATREMLGARYEGEALDEGMYPLGTALLACPNEGGGVGNGFGDASSHLPPLP